MRLFLATLCASLLAGMLLLPAQAVAPRIFRNWTRSDVVDAAAIFASKLDKHQASTIQFIDLASIPPDKRARKLQALGYVTNSLSQNDLIALPQEVPGTELALAWFDWADLRQRDDVRGLKKLLEARDRLGELGSGAAPFPEPFFHQRKTEYADAYKEVAYGLYYDAYGRGYSTPAPGRTWRTTETRKVAIAGKKKQTVALSGALNKGTVIGLAALLDTNFPIFDYRWFVTNALSEPRYHELLGLDDSEKSAIKLADANEQLADDIGAQLRGAILFSTVSRRNRIVERTPTRQRHGRGTFQRSLDFKTSVDAQDVLKDTLVQKADAHEIIWTLPNGLQGFYVSDGNGKRLDVAVADIATSRNSRWEDPQVRTAFMCMDCHLREKGWIEVDDEIRAMAKTKITIAALAFENLGGKERDRGRRVRQKYLQEDLNILLRMDQTLVESSVRAATGGVYGLTSAETHKEVIGTIVDYVQTPVTAEQLAFELGVSKARLFQGIEYLGPAADHALTGLRGDDAHKGRPQRRDQIESAYGQIATALYLRGER